MNGPPAVIVHSLPMAQLALAAGRPATLLSAPGAAGFMGVGWWQALVRAAGGGTTADILDCGWSAGRALEAMRAGQRALILRASPPVWQDLSERAQDCGAILLDEAPPALDLGQHGAERQLAAWLAAGDKGQSIG